MTYRKIRCLEDILHISDRTAPLVTLFSGGLDSSYILSHLQSAGFQQVYALCVDLGEGIDYEQLKETAECFGARLVVRDHRADFADTYVSAALRAHAQYLNIFPISSSIGRPLIAKAAVTLARELNASAVVHTANQSQNSLRRLNTAIEDEGFEGYYGSPYEFSALSRDDKAKALAGYGLHYYTGRKLSGDANIWCREFESGPLDNPENFELPLESFTWTRRIDGQAPMTVALTFEQGHLTQIDGQDMRFVDAIAWLNEKIGSYGHGRFVGLEHLDAGEKVLEVREAPAAFILMAALRHLETAVLSSSAIVLKQAVEQLWTQEAVEGRWHSDVRVAADAAITNLTSRVSGTVTFTVTDECCLPSSIVAKDALYLTDRDGWEIDKAQERGARSLADLRQPFIQNTHAPTEKVA